MRKLVTTIAFGLSLIAHSQPAAATPTAQQLIAAADAIRNPGRPFRITNSLTEYVNGVVRNRSTVVVYAKAHATTRQYQNIVRYTAPARDAGKVLLLSGTALWLYDSSSKSSIRIAPQQRLVGQASNGDVLTVNLSADYASTLKGAETISDPAGRRLECWALELRASSANAVYSRMSYWIEQGTNRPIKAKYFSPSGRVLKIAYFQNYTTYLGASRPAETVIIDGVNPRLVTTIRTSQYAFQAIPDLWFQRDFLPRLPF